MSNADLIREMIPDAPVDPWGHSMGLMFDVCAKMTMRGVPVPMEWGYRPPLMGVEIEDEFVESMLDMYADNDTLLRIGKILHRYVSRLDAAGRSY